MKNRFTSLEIKNFKSIKHLTIDCKRINILIGEPNVGKTNILEALSMYLAEVCSNVKPFLKDYIRYEKLSNLFYDQDRRNIISVESNIGSAYFQSIPNSTKHYGITLLPPYLKLHDIPVNESEPRIDLKFQEYISEQKTKAYSFPVKPYYSIIPDGESYNKRRDLEYNTPVKRYIFKSLSSHDSHYPLFLHPPFGDNLYTILESNPGIYDEATSFFNKHHLDLLIDTETEKLDVQKRVGNRVYKIPFSLSADTLQRIIFHLAAIETNNASVLLFEEPEAHSFPKYISLIAEKVIESKQNQFFIATHSPYLLSAFIEECNKNEVAIFVCTYKDYETKAKALTDKEIGNIMETGIDLFYNLPAFQND